jgi:lysophospholipase L1-like esterase
VLFVGSSTIVRWKTLAEDFPETLVLNRGFGGNQIADSTHYAERMIFPYAPSMIVLRAGGNDIHAGRSAEEVFGDYKDFVAKVRTKFADVPIAYLALSPAISRITEREEGDKLNALISAFIKENKNLIFIDTSKVSLGSDGQPVPELFVADKLHFSPAGYKILTDVVRPFMPKNKAK